MTSCERTIVLDCKTFIDKGAIQQLQTYVRNLRTDYDWSEGEPDWAWILQKVYLHACLRKQGEIAAWLEDLFHTQLDPVQQIAYRHTLNYGRVLLRK